MLSNMLLSVMCQFEVIGADMSSHDKSFTRVIAKTEIEQQVGLFNSTGEPTFGALAKFDGRLQVLGERLISRRLVQSGGFGVQWCKA
jgi:hypothetical protein